jgi:hypothetical protein
MANENVIKRKGIVITLRDGKDYVVLPLPIDDLIEIWPLVVKLENKQENVNVELLNDIKHLTYVALKGSNEIKESEIGKLVDLSDLQEIIKVIVGQKAKIDS